MTLSARMRIALLIIVVSGVSGAVADNGDDISNNLFSDLTPLLALFGEQFAKQFMSESMTWLDHIIFAMAPLGILTALVGAIRVGGPSWLKSVIGRARENRATAEVELMSSTSHEVCELWNGQAVVRTLGKPRIRELVYLEEWRDEGEFGLYTLMEAKEKGYLINEPHKGPLVPLFERAFKRTKEVIAREKELREYLDEERGSQQPSPPEDTSHLRDGPQLEDAPNISLNLHRGSKTQDLFFAAVCGILLQAGVLVYTGLVTYHPRFKSNFRKGGQPVRGYAYPVMAIGTMALAFGMMICSYIIEHSTTEEKWVAGPAGPPSSMGKPAKPKELVTSILWLQKSHVVSDQSFDSYVVFARGKRNEILTSRRLRSPTADRENNRNLAHRYSYGSASTADATPRILETLTLVGILAGLSGFVLQFEGFRGMHWSATIAQLAAILAMTILRAWVRREMTVLPRAERVLHEHEMDWLAVGIAMEPSFWGEYSGSRSLSEDDGSKAQRRESSKEPWAKESLEWKILTGASNLAHRGHWYKPPYPTQPVTTVQEAVRVRQRLGKLTKWTGLASKPAISVAAAIGIVMKTFFGSASGEKRRWWVDPNEQSTKIPQPAKETQRFVWSLRASVGSKDQNVYFTVQKSDKGVWEADATEIEAALSLWIFHVRKSAKEAQRSRKSDGNKDWLQSEDAVLKGQYHQVLGTKTNALQRDLAWWTADGITQDSPDEAVNPKNGHVGFIGIQPETPNPGHQSTSLDPLIVVSNTTLELLFAQHMFSAFMWAIAEKIPVELFDGRTTVDQKDIYNTNDPTAWRSAKLENTTLSEMAKDIQRTGLGTLEEVFMCIVPPLSVGKKLPVEAMVDFVRQNMKDHEVNGNWEEAGRTYLELIRMSKAIGSKDQFVYKALAAAIEFLWLVIESLAAERCLENGKRAASLEKARSDLVAEMQGLGLRDAIADLRQIYEMQSRAQEYQGLFQELQEGVSVTSRVSSNRLSELLRHTPLHQAIIGGESLNDDGMDKYIQTKDTLDWTPLHYAVVQSEEGLTRILKRGTNVNAKDITERTPLHYVASQGRETFGMLLLERGAQIGARGRDGMSPLHCAAKVGNLEVVALLLKWDADIKAQDNWRRAALHLAAAGGHEAVVRLLLEKGAAVAAADRWGATPLLWAAGFGHGAVVQLLLEKGSDVATKGDSGETALHRAAANGHETVVRVLLSTGADVAAEGVSEETPLHRAAVSGSGAVVSLLLECGADVAARGRSGEMPLHQAAMNGHAKVAQLLLERGSDLEARDERGWTALHWTAKNGCETVAQLLVAMGADIEPKDKEGSTPLCLAAKSEHEVVAKLLLKEGAEVEAKDSEGCTPLCWAARNGNEAVARLLVETGADVKAEDTRGWTTLHWAAKSGHEAVAQLLIAVGADLEAVDPGASTPLCSAVRSEHEGVARLLLEQGANIEARDGEGLTPLCWAARNGHSAEARLLVKFGANVEAKDEWGWTALHWAAKNGQEALAQLLADQGINIEAKDNRGRTALHDAAEYGRELVAQLLVRRAADVGARDNEGQTPLHNAARSGHEAVVRLLAENGADVKAVDMEGQTALHRASRSGHQAVARLLIAEGADVEATDEWEQIALQKGEGLVTTTNLPMDVESEYVRDGQGVMLADLNSPSWHNARDANVSSNLATAANGDLRDGILPRCSIAAIAWPDEHCRVYFQDVLGGVREARYSNGEWNGGDDESVLFKAKLHTPLAVIDWDSGQQIRIYYLSQQDILQEYCYSSTAGWYHGDLNELRIKTDSRSRIHALEWSSGKIRLYCQESTSNAIQEYCYEHAWVRGTTLPRAFRGSSLSAATWVDNGIHIRLYYQDALLNIKEHCWDDGWYVGLFNPGTAPANTSITAFGWYGHDVQVRVYWQDASGSLVELRWDEGWNPHPVKVIERAEDRVCFSGVQWGNGDHGRVYFQGAANEVLEERHEEGKWFRGAVVAR